jgi:hypothetical protein
VPWNAVAKACGKERTSWPMPSIKAWTRTLFDGPHPWHGHARAIDALAGCVPPARHAAPRWRRLCRHARRRHAPRRRRFARRTPFASQRGSRPRWCCRRMARTASAPPARRTRRRRWRRRRRRVGAPPGRLRTRAPLQRPRRRSTERVHRRAPGGLGMRPGTTTLRRRLATTLAVPLRSLSRYSSVCAARRSQRGRLQAVVTRCSNWS